MIVLLGARARVTVCTQLTKAYGPKCPAINLFLLIYIYIYIINIPVTGGPFLFSLFSVHCPLKK